MTNTYTLLRNDPTCLMVQDYDGKWLWFHKSEITYEIDAWQVTITTK